MQEMQVGSLGWENPLEQETAACSSILPWKILWTEEPGRLQPMRSQRVRHGLVTKQQQSVLMGLINVEMLNRPCKSVINPT